jgi:hypothetical protein
MISPDQWVGLDQVAGPDAWQQATTLLTSTAGTDHMDFWQWAWYWQRTPGFPYAPPGFGILGSLDTIAALDQRIIAISGVDGNQAALAQQWVDAYRQVWSTPLP